MSLDTYLDGSLVGTTRIRLRANGDQGVAIANAADGTAAEAGIVFDDPDSTMSVPAWRPCYVVETLCTTAPRLFTGYVTGRTYRRGHYRTGGGREIDTTIFDSNVLLQMHRINGGDSKRPAETFTARMAWLMASGYIPIVQDLGFIISSAVIYDATDYKHQFPSDVLLDLCGPRDLIFFVYWDQSAAALGLFVDSPDATTYTSTLTISNVLSDVDDTTCFAPYLDDESTLDPSEVYSDIAYLYAGGVYYGANITTRSTFFPSPILHRDTLVENMKVGKPTTAALFANRILARDSKENQIITMTVKLPAAKVGLIDAGHRLSVKLSHVPGFTSFTYTRVEQITKVQTEGTPDFYDVGLRLSTHGIIGGGGTGSGSTLPFPISSGTPPPLIQYAFGTSAVVLPTAPTDGDLMIGWVTERGTGTYPPAFTGWTSIATAKNVSIFGDNYYARLMYRIASGDTATVLNMGTGNYNGTVVEWGQAVLGASVAQSDLNSATFTAGGPIAASAGSILMGFGVVFTFFVGSVTPDTGVTELIEQSFSGNAPTNWVGYRTITTATTDYAGGTLTGSPGRLEYGGVSLVITPAAGSDAPLPGQPVINEFVANGDGTTVTFTTANGYAPLSLRVWVDGVAIILGLTETNPTAGTFTLDFAPRGAVGDSAASKIYVSYVTA